MGGDPDRFTNPTEPPRIKNHPARMVRSAVRLRGDVCRAIVVVDALAVVWVVTWTASRTLRNYRVSKATPARLVRSAVRLLGDVCRAIVVVDALGVVWVVTRTASRTLRKKPPEMDLPRRLENQCV